MPSGAASRQTKRMFFAPRFLQPVDRGDRRVRGRQHRVEHEHQAVGHILRRLEVILDRHQRLRIAIEPDMRDARGRARGSSMPSRKPMPARRIGASTSFLPASTGAFIGASGVSMSIIFERQVARHLVAEQHADLVEQLAEALGRALLVAHQRELVLHQRMIDDGDALHARRLPRSHVQNTVPSLTTAIGGLPSARLLAREPPAGRPGAAFEHARQRKLRRSSSPRRSRTSGAISVEQRHGQRAPLHHQRRSRPDWDGSRLRGSRRRSTPASTNRPPLRYSARPVRPSMSVTVMPDHCSGSISE